MRTEGKTVGFTGTRTGVTGQQSHMMFFALDGAAALHHGCCKGADEHAHAVAKNIGTLEIVGHPPSITKAMMPLNPAEFTTLHLPKPYLVRNQAIVDATQCLIAVPAHMYEEDRSGTWSTVRYARNMGKPVMILWPNGNVRYERWDDL